jgi:beta-lactam-binding protein with PASTA domain
MNFMDRARWFGRMVMLTFVLASVAFLSAITAMRIAIHGREVTVPNLTGKSSLDAEREVAAKGLGFRIEDRAYSDKPQDAVVRQSPPAESTVKTGQFVHVVVSLGRQRVTIPVLNQSSSRLARIELLRDGLQAGEISSLYLPEYPEDTVLEQSPAPGRTDAASPRVDLLISLGPRPDAFVMMDLRGLAIEEARRRLESGQFRLGKLTAPSETGPPSAGANPGPTGTATPLSGSSEQAAVIPAAEETVVAQNPAAGSRVEAGGTVDLTIAGRDAPIAPPVAPAPAAPPVPAAPGHPQ